MKSGRLRNRLRLFSLALLIFPLSAARAPAQPPSVSLELLADGLEIPVFVTHAGDSRLFVVLKTGRILIYEDGRILPRPFLDIEGRVRSTGTEQGLTSMAFAPDYATSGFFFLPYIDLSGDSVLARFRVTADPDVADPQSEVKLLEVPQPFSNHNGGQVQFGPDGMLYYGLGDGGSAFDPQCNAQNDDTLLGKLLRLDVGRNRNSPPFFAVPPDNPFVGPGDPPDVVWAEGLRNPWRFSFDRTAGNLYIADVGQNEWEEVNFLPSGSPGGRNFGWKTLEGNLCLGDAGGCSPTPPGCGSAAYTAPVLTYRHGPPDFHCSITGGYVYRGTQISGLRGFYLYGDFCSGILWAARRNASGAWVSFALDASLPGLTSFGEGRLRELYLVGGDSLFRLVSGGGSEPGVIELTAGDFSAQESSGEMAIVLRRSQGSDGNVSATLTVAAGSATADVDYVQGSYGTSWGPGETGERTIRIPIIDDTGVEGEETFTVEIGSVSGSATIGPQASATARIVDDDEIPAPCTPDAETLCLNDGRFRLTLDWRTRAGASGAGQAVPLTGDTGFFWFFNPANVEAVVKVLDGCATALGGFWVFAAGLTNVETTLRVQDVETGFSRLYTNPLGAAFQPVQDTAAFDTCP